MAQPFSAWSIIQNATNDEAAAILMQDPVWNCFALADLEPPLRAYSQFAVAYQQERDERAICLILRHPIIGEVISPFGSVEGVAALLHQIELPERPLLQAQEVYIPALQQRYQLETSWRGMWRMAVTAHSLQAPTQRTPQPIQQLTSADVPALQQLYSQQSEIAFSAKLFAQGIYFGAYEGAQIIAAGGTHALTPAYQLAVLGHILTAPEARQQGYATAITAALATTLLQQHFSTIVLNVFADNQPAIRIYQRLGFQTHHRMVGGRATLVR